MSRSKRRTPKTGITTAASDKAFKTAEHRRERRAQKAVDYTNDDAPHPKEFGNPHKSEKDGKQWLSSAIRDRHMRK